MFGFSRAARLIDGADVSVDRTSTQPRGALRVRDAEQNWRIMDRLDPNAALAKIERAASDVFLDQLVLLHPGRRFLADVERTTTEPRPVPSNGTRLRERASSISWETSGRASVDAPAT